MDQHWQRMKFHSAVGTGAGVAQGPDGRHVPVVTLYFAKHPETIDHLESGEAEFDPDNDDNWHQFALSLRGARQLVADLHDAIESAIQGPPNEG